MELQKLSQEIDVGKLLDELSDLMSLKAKEKDMIYKYQRGYILEKAIERCESEKHNKAVLDEVLAIKKHEAYIIALEILDYKTKAEKYSKFWNPAMLYEIYENCDFDKNDGVQHQIDYVYFGLECEIRRKEIELKNAKDTVKKYKENGKRGQQ